MLWGNFSPWLFNSVPPLEVAVECDLSNPLRLFKAVVMRVMSINKPARPPIAIPTMAPVEIGLPLPDPDSGATVSVGEGLRVVVKSVDGIDSSREESVLGEGVRMGDLFVTIVVFLVMVTLE